MLLGIRKRAGTTQTVATAATQTTKHQRGPKGQKARTPSQRDATTTEKGGPESTTHATSLAVLSGAAMALGEKQIFRPAAHLQPPSDVSFVARDKKQGFLLHSFILNLRSPIFAAMLTTHGGALAEGNPSRALDVEPIVLPESGKDLR